jgi:oxaloacetate decarboxylase gamma subunit
METTLTNGLTLLLIGMSTVFFILSIIVLVGNLLIYSTNKWAVQDIAIEKPNLNKDSGKHIAVITSVVSHLTSGKGKIDTITKIKN